MGLVPGVLALLPEYAGLSDPVAGLRAACLTAVAWLAEAGPVTVVADDQGRRVAAALLAACGASAGTTDVPGPAGAPGPAGGPGPNGRAVLVVANGTARRGEKAPGHLDERAPVLDAALDAALRAPDPDALAGLDVGLAEQLLAGNPAGLRALGELLEPGCATMVDYADDPFGVQYWVMRWGPCAS